MDMFDYACDVLEQYPDEFNICATLEKRIADRQVLINATKAPMNENVTAFVLPFISHIKSSWYCGDCMDELGSRWWEVPVQLKDYHTVLSVPVADPSMEAQSRFMCPRHIKPWREMLKDFWKK